MASYVAQTATRTAERALVGTALGFVAGLGAVGLAMHGVPLAPAMVPAAGLAAPAYAAVGAKVGAWWGVAESAVGKSLGRAWSQTPNGLLNRA